MTRFRTQALALSALAAASLTARAFAGSPYDPPVDEAQADAAQAGDSDSNAIPQRRMGHFTCSYNERRTRLERKDCGGSRY